MNLARRGCSSRERLVFVPAIFETENLKLENLLNIRPATIADVPFMISLERQCPSAAHWTDQQHQSLFPVLPPALFQSAESRSERLILVAEESPSIATDAAVRPIESREILGFLVARHISREWELENIVVASTARRKGLGKRLLQALLNAMRETNTQDVFLEVRESNAAARALYEKAGFRQTGRRKAYYEDPPEDALLYHLSLD
jgi:ribosomal-protein-alanine acetyltransferase